MVSDIEISNLRDFPEWVSEIASWHHSEWLRGYAISADTNPALIKRDDIREREHNLRIHLQHNPIPVTFIAHIANPRASETGERPRQPIGSVSLVLYQFSRTRQPTEWVTNLYVEDGYRKMGVGQRLLRHIEEYAATQGLAHIRLYTRDRADYYRKRDWTFTHNGVVQGNAVSVLEKRFSTECEHPTPN